MSGRCIIRADQPEELEEEELLELLELLEELELLELLELPEVLPRADALTSTPVEAPPR